MKRAGAILIAVILTALVVAACGGDATPTPPAPTPTTVPPTATRPPATPTPAAPPTAAQAATPTRAAPAPTATPRPSPTAAPTPTAAAAIKRGGVLRTRMTGDPAPWDVVKGPLSNTAGPTVAVVSTLLQHVGVPVPKLTGDLAESWEVSGGGTVITFRLVRGVQWHDGSPLTAADVKYQLDRVFLGKGGYTSFLSGFFAAAQQVEAPDPSTVRVTLKQPSNAFMAAMPIREFLIYAPQVSDEELNKGKVVGSGAFVWDRWERGVKITVRANPNFFRRDPQGGRLPYLDGIEYHIIADDAAHLAAFRAGRTDLWDIYSVPSLLGHVESLKRDIPGLKDFLTPPSLFDMIFVRNAPPFNDLRVRQAMQYGLDRKLFAEAALQNLGTGTGFMLPGPDLGFKYGLKAEAEKTFPGIDPARRAQDLAMARDLMRQAGYGPDKPLKVVMHLSTGGQEPKATVAAAALRDAGFDITLNPEENATHNRRLVIGGDFLLLYRNLGLRVDDPAQTVGTFVTATAPRNYSAWSDPEVDRLYAEQEVTTDLTRRPAIIQEMLKRIYTQGYNIIAGWSQRPWVTKPETKNFPIDGSWLNLGRHETTWQDR